jgi:D-glycero-D-manno-heptose 1,7-bisphosphate phosphatase
MTSPLRHGCRVTVVSERPTNKPRWAVFFDRDGTINEDSASYITRVDQVRLLPGAAAAIRLLNQSRIPVIVVTNQAAVAYGLLTEDELARINARILELLQLEAQAKVDALYYCPFHPDGAVAAYRRSSHERKPAPGMLLRAARELALDLPRSFLIGDRESDILAAHSAGCRGIAVPTGPAWPERARWRDAEPDYLAANALDAVGWILRQHRGRRSTATARASRRRRRRK